MHAIVGRRGYSLMEQYWHQVELFADPGTEITEIRPEPQNEEEYMEFYSNIINILATASLHQMMVDPDNMHYAFIELPLTYKEGQPDEA
jgi:hypothetical protein